MVITSELIPCPQLQPYVRHFAYRELNSFDIKIQRPLFATFDFLITFNLSEKRFGYIKPLSDSSNQQEEMLKSEIVISGIGSRFAGMMTSIGNARLFSIYFTPTGFYRIFGIPAIYYTDRIDEDESTCSHSLKMLLEQLRESVNVADMIKRCESFLIRQLARSKAKDSYDTMQIMSGVILQSGGSASVEEIARQANMSMKTFERRFIEQVGAPPKLFSRIARFNKAIDLKMHYPKKSWTDIAYTCGYYDQMHFIKNFKHFSGTTPNSFFKNTPPLAESFVESSAD